jgi:hypothetical protein
LAVILAGVLPQFSFANYQEHGTSDPLAEAHAEAEAQAILERLVSEGIVRIDEQTEEVILDQRSMVELLRRDGRVVRSVAKEDGRCPGK